MNPKIAAIQMSSGLSLEANLEQAGHKLEEAVAQGAALAVLPEMFPLIAPNGSVSIQEHKGQGRIQDFLSQTARRLNLWIIGGTIPLVSPEPHRAYAASLVFNDQGECVAEYDKIHLFDVSLSEHESYRESETIYPGSQIVVIDTPVGRLGLSVCYDLRFPELYREMFQRGAQVFVVPAAFTVPTGTLHWEVLLRARAIENFCYVVAAAQWGTHESGRKTFGDSLIIDPNGQILAQLISGTGVIVSEIDLNLIQRQRSKIPVHEHVRISIDPSTL